MFYNLLIANKNAFLYEFSPKKKKKLKMKIANTSSSLKLLIKIMQIYILGLIFANWIKLKVDIFPPFFF